MDVKITVQGHDVVVACGTEETLLRAGLRAGLQLPYECASGGCGSCRAKLVEGEVLNLWPDATGLSERDRRRGDRILMCQSVPESDCTITANAIKPSGTVEPAPVRTIGRLSSRIALNADTALFTLALDDEMNYLPGQFVVLESPERVRRAYSMARPCPEGRTTVIEFIIRAKPSGIGSDWLFNTLAVGDAIAVEGPYGRAYARSEAGRPAICVAGGTGLAPMLAIAEYLSAGGACPSLHVYVGARSDTDIVLLDRLEELHKRGAVISFSVERNQGNFPKLHAGERSPFASVRTGRVVDHLAQDWNDLSAHDLYLGGPAGMVDAALRSLVGTGIANADRVFFDRFSA